MLRQSFLLVTMVLALSMLLPTGCSTQRQLDEPDAILKAYEGAKLVKDKIATVSVNYPVVIVGIDGDNVVEWISTKAVLCETCSTHRHSKPVPKYRGAELLPGDRVIEYWCSGPFSSAVMGHLSATLLPGHTYELHCKPEDLYVLWPHQYAVWLTDKSTGDVVSGRTPAVFEWSWGEFKEVLRDLKRDGATEDKVLEILATPYAGLQDNTLVYPACPNAEGVLRPWPAIKDEKGKCGFLFLEFDVSKRMHDYTYVDVPIAQCKQKFFAWKLKPDFYKCHYGIERIGRAKFRAITGKPYEAYLELEKGLISPNRSEMLLQQSRNILAKYPKMLMTAKSHFTKAGFEQAVAEHGVKAKDIERKRLSVFEELAQPGDYKNAEREFADFFDPTPKW